MCVWYPQRKILICTHFSKFIKIEDSDQRQQYKQEFNREYVEYRELHKEVDEVARKFQKLRSQINETEEGTRDFEVGF